MKINFFERIFFYHFKALMGFASLFSWNRDDNYDEDNSKTLSGREEVIMHWLLLFWCTIVEIYSLIFSFAFFEFVFFPNHRKIAFIISFILAILSMFPIIRWWERKKYVQSYAAFKDISSKDENYVVWLILTTLLVLIACVLPIVFPLIISFF